MPTPVIERFEHVPDELLPAWIAEAWPLSRPRYVGRDLSRAEWLAIPRES